MLTVNILPGIDLADHYLKSNDPLSGVERARVQKLVDLDLETAGVLDRRIQDLVEQRKRLQVVIDFRQTVIAPIRRIPPEIFIHVFSHYLRDMPLHPITPNSNDFCEKFHFAPWILSQVSLEWRKIMFSTSSFWKDVYMDISGCTGVQKRSMLCLASRQMALSGNRPLNIFLRHTHRKLHTVDKHAFNILLDIILAHKERWRKLVVHSDEMYMGSTVAKLFGGPDRSGFPNVEELRVVADRDLDGLDDAIPTDCHFPALRRIVIGQMSPDPPPNLPWEQITFLDTKLVVDDDLLPILPRLIHLEVLKLQSTAGFQNVGYDGLSLHLPALRDLAVNNNYHSEIVSAIVAPSLEYLQIGWEGWGVQGDIGHEMDKGQFLFIHRMLSRSKCSIKSFRGCIAATGAQLKFLLSTLPHLTSLDIKLLQTKTAAAGSVVDILEELRVKDGDGTFSVLPQLTNIVFHEFPLDADEREALISTMRLRCGKGVNETLRLVNFNASTWENMSELTAETVHAVQDIPGLEVELGLHTTERHDRYPYLDYRL